MITELSVQFLEFAIFFQQPNFLPGQACCQHLRSSSLIRAVSSTPSPLTFVGTRHRNASIMPVLTPEYPGVEEMWSGRLRQKNPTILRQESGGSDKRMEDEEEIGLENILLKCRYRRLAFTSSFGSRGRAP